MNREESEDEKVPGLKDQIDCLTLARALLQRMGNITEKCSRALFQCQMALRIEKRDKMNQSTTMDPIVKK